MVERIPVLWYSMMVIAWDTWDIEAAVLVFVYLALDKKAVALDTRVSEYSVLGRKAAAWDIEVAALAFEFLELDKKVVA